MKNLEEKIAEMQKQLDELKKQVKPTFEVGKWYKDENSDCIFNYVSDGNSYGVQNGNWISYSWVVAGNGLTWKTRPATDKEVEEALVKEAIKRGFKKNVKINRNDLNFRPNMGKSKLTSNSPTEYRPEYNRLEMFGVSIFEKGVWAEIIKDESIKINGFDVVKDNESYNIGCKHLYKVELQYIEMFMERNDYTYVTFSSENNAHKVTLETINKILSL